MYGYNKTKVLCVVVTTKQIVWLLKAKMDNTRKKNGTKINLVPLDAEFFVQQYIQNPLKSVLGKIDIKVLI